MIDLGDEGLLAAGEMRLVEAGRRRLLLARDRAGRYHATSPRCPHQGVDLCGGRLVGRVVSSGPGEVGYEDSAQIVRCPRHGWEFDVTTGRSTFDPAVRLRVISVRVEGGRVLLEVA